MYSLGDLLEMNRRFFFLIMMDGKPLMTNGKDVAYFERMKDY